VADPRRRPHDPRLHRADFHPDHHDTSDLLEHWRAELLGPEGTISDRLAAKKTA
jgi:hypothetical protein